MRFHGLPLPDNALLLLLRSSQGRPSPLHSISQDALRRSNRLFPRVPTSVWLAPPARRPATQFAFLSLDWILPPQLFLVRICILESCQPRSLQVRHFGLPAG